MHQIVFMLHEQPSCAVALIAFARASLAVQSPCKQAMLAADCTHQMSLFWAPRKLQPSVQHSSTIHGQPWRNKGNKNDVNDAVAILAAHNVNLVPND